MREENQKAYLFTLDYGDRMKEKGFIKDLLRTFNRDKLTGIVLFVNNNPYNLELYLFLCFEGETADFERWLYTNYRDMKRNYGRYYSFFIGKRI